MVHARAIITALALCAFIGYSQPLTVSELAWLKKRVDCPAPEKPAAFVSVEYPDANYVTNTWSASTGATGYILRVTTNSVDQFVYTDQTNYGYPTFPEVPYAFYVAATNACGASDYKGPNLTLYCEELEPVTTTFIISHTFTDFDAGFFSVTIGWSGAVGATGYRIEYYGAPNTGEPDPQFDCSIPQMVVGHTQVTNFTYSISSETGYSHLFRIVATNACGEITHPDGFSCASWAMNPPTFP
jgi:hypothetical protein